MSKMTTTSFRDKCIGDLKTIIKTPASGSYIKNTDNARFCYEMEGRLKYIYLTTPLEFARFAVKHGFIYTYALIEEDVKMYQLHQPTAAGANGELVWLPTELISVEWDRIIFTPSDVLNIAARHEYELACRSMGMIKAKIVHLSNHFLQVAS